MKKSYKKWKTSEIKSHKLVKKVKKGEKSEKKLQTSEKKVTN